MLMGYSLGDLGSIMAMQGFAGLILFSVFVLMALGLAVIFGQMGVINMAHGEFMILGAYVTFLTSRAVHDVSSRRFNIYFFVAVRPRVLRLGLAGYGGGMGPDPASLSPAARYSAGDLGPQSDPAAGLSVGVRRAGGRASISRSG